MSKPAAPDEQGTSTRPYLIRALHEWCTDNGFTPFLAVHVTPGVKVPMEYVKNNEIVLNVGFEATSGLRLGNDLVEFKARFGGMSREIAVPIDHVVAIYARENGQGMAFPVPTVSADAAPPAEPARTGLRLAGLPDPDPDGDQAVPKLPVGVPVGLPVVLPVDGLPPDPHPPAPGGRPALKRVK
jgi:stringent starvation protein B